MRFPTKIKPRVAFGLPYLLVEIFYIGMPVVRTDGRSGVQSHDYQKISRMGRLPNVLTHGAPLCTLRARGAPLILHLEFRSSLVRNLMNTDRHL